MARIVHVDQTPLSSDRSSGAAQHVILSPQTGGHESEACDPVPAHGIREPIIAMNQSFGRLIRIRMALLCAIASTFGTSPIGMSFLSGTAQAQDVTSAVFDLELKDVSMAFGVARVTVPKLFVSGTRLSKDQILEIFAADGKEPWPARLARLDAASFVAPELRVEQVQGSSRHIATYHDVSAKRVHGGRISEFTVAGATIAIEGGAEAGQGSYGQIRAEEVDLAAMARLYTEAGDAKGPFQRLYGSYAVADIAFTGGKTSISIAQVSSKDVSGRPIPETWGGATKVLAALHPDAPNPDANDPIDRTKAFGTLADLVESIDVGSAEAIGFSVKTMEGIPASFTIGRLAYAGDGQARGMALSDIRFAGSGTNLQIAGVKLNGYSLSPTLATLRRIASTADLSDSELRRLTPLIGTLTFSGLAVDLADEPGSDGKVADGDKDPIAKDDTGPANGSLHIGVREGTLTFGPPRDGVPIASQLNLSGLTLPSSAVAGIPGLGSLGLYGYRDLDLKLVADTVWNEESKELALREISISGKDMGTLRINATLGGIGPDVFDPDIGVSTYAMLSTNAKALDLTLENGGLFERFLDAQAKTLSLKPDELRKEYVTASVIGVPVILGNSAAAKAIGAAMGKFVSKPGTLSISAKAKNGTGLGVGDFSTAASPGAVLDKLEVNAKAE